MTTQTDSMSLFSPTKTTDFLDYVKPGEPLSTENLEDLLQKAHQAPKLNGQAFKAEWEKRLRTK